MDVTAKRNAALGATVVKNLERRGFAAYYYASHEEALAKALELIPETDLVGWGGGVTMEQIGLIAAVKARNKVVDRSKGRTPEERMEIMRRCLLSDTFIMGVNAISEDGDLIQIDGTGNRTAAMIFGPKNIIVVAGMNKVCKTYGSAYDRARSFASTINVQRFPQKKTPCIMTGRCADCFSPDCICNYILHVRRSNPVGRIKVILIGESLGF